MLLDLSPLEKAVASLERALAVADRGIHGPVNTPEEEVIRAGVVQNFEFTYELSWKFMKRWLENNLGGVEVDGVTRKELFRIAAEQKLVETVEDWFSYHEARNQTAHAYDPAKAQQVFETAQRFVFNARSLLEALRARND